MKVYVVLIGSMKIPAFVTIDKNRAHRYAEDYTYDTELEVRAFTDES